MRIGIETTALGSRLTGTSRYIYCLLEQLKAGNDEIKMFSNTNHFNNTIINTVLSKCKNGIQRNFYRQFLLPGEMTKESINCGIFPDYFMPAQFEKPSAVIIHDLSFISHPHFYSKSFVYYYNRQIKNTLKNKPVIVTVSENSKEQMHKLLDVKYEDIFLLQAYSGLFKDKISRDNVFNNKPYLLYVGHVEPRKNLTFLVENFLKWKKERGINLALLIAGEIWIKSSEIKELLEKYSGHPDVIFTGYVEEESLYNLYSNAAGFVHTSLVEGFGFPVLEAMHFGLPVICSKDTGAEEISSPGSIVIDPRNSLSLKNGLDMLYDKYLLNEKPVYKIKYSPELMRIQLNSILELLESRINNKIFYHSKNHIGLEDAVEKTLLYSSLFNSGIKKSDLIKSLMDVKTTGKDLSQAVQALLDRKKILLKNNVYYLNTSNTYPYKREEYNKKPGRSLAFIKLLKLLPLIDVIAFSGGTAHYGIARHDDIDLFIITKPYCLYIVYIVIHFASLLFGLRKTICANYLIDSKKTEITSPHDFYTAHQVISLVPYKNENGFNDFLYKNRWVSRFYPNFEIKYVKQKPSSPFYTIAAPLNGIIMTFYKILYKKKIHGIKNESLKITPHCLKLHTNDHRLKITALFEKEWRSYCMQKVNDGPEYYEIPGKKREARNSEPVVTGI